MRLDSTNYASGADADFPFRVVGKRLTHVPPGGAVWFQHSKGFFSLRGAEQLVELLGVLPEWDDLRIYQYRGYVPVAFAE